MEHYYVNHNAQPTKGHEIHKKDCIYFPTEWSYLGSFATFEEAAEKAKSVYPHVIECQTCLSNCHIK